MAASEVHRPNDRRLSAELVPSFADRGRHVDSVTDPYDRNLDWVTREATFFQVAPQLVSGG
jgi:hypothetical protein